jgi:hypothetical protein
MFIVEDLIEKGLGRKNDDILIGEAPKTQNAFALIYNQGSTIRRMVLWDNDWTERKWKEANAVGGVIIILAHEIGHHVCRHTIEAFRHNPRQMELEADRAAGALLRKAGRVGSGDYTAEQAATILLKSTESQTHPPSQARHQAFMDGFHNGSPCLLHTYEPIDPVKPNE